MVHFGPIGRHPIVRNSPHCEAPNTKIGIFFHNNVFETQHLLGMHIELKQDLHKELQLPKKVDLNTLSKSSED